MAAPSHVWRVVTCSLCLVQVNFHVHTCHDGNYIFCLSRARIVSDYQSYIAHHIALQEHNSITHRECYNNLQIWRATCCYSWNHPDPTSIHHPPIWGIITIICVLHSPSQLHFLPPYAMFGAITGTQLRPRTANWTEIESSCYVEEVSVRMITGLGPKGRCTSQVSC